MKLDIIFWVFRFMAIYPKRDSVRWHIFGDNRPGGHYRAITDDYRAKHFGAVGNENAFADYRVS